MRMICKGMICAVKYCVHFSWDSEATVCRRNEPSFIRLWPRTNEAAGYYLSQWWLIIDTVLWIKVNLVSVKIKTLYWLKFASCGCATLYLATWTQVDGVMTWLRFWHNWSFARGIRRSPVVSQRWIPIWWPVMQAVAVFFVVIIQKLFNEQSNCRCHMASL